MQESKQGTVRYIRLLTQKTTAYIDKTIKKDVAQIPQRYFDEYNNTLYSLNGIILDFKKREYELDKSQMLYYINHTYMYENKFNNKFPYWYFSSVKGKMTVNYYKHCYDNVYNISRTKQTVFDNIPNIYVFGNCTFIVDDVVKEPCYLSTEHRLYHVLQRNNAYYGIKLDFNKKPLEMSLNLHKSGELFA